MGNIDAVPAKIEGKHEEGGARTEPAEPEAEATDATPPARPPTPAAPPPTTTGPA